MRVDGKRPNRRKTVVHIAHRSRRLSLTLGTVCFAALSVLSISQSALAQGSRKDDIVFGPSGHPIANATVRVCQATATGTPCTPLATLYTDTTLTTTAPNPLQADGIGNYHFYAPAGRYVIQITGPGITGTTTYPDVILAPDVSSNSSGNNISAFGLTLGGNLNVAGNATINGTLTTSDFSPGTFSPTSLAVSGNASVAGPRPYIDVTAPPYNADPTGHTDSTAAIQAAITAACNHTISGADARPGVYFPPGWYTVTQTQTTTSASAPVFTTCGDLYLYANGSQGDTLQFRNPPQGATIQVNAGTSPNNAPVFLFQQQNNVTVTNLAINGYNQAIGIRSSTNIRLENNALYAYATSQTDNTPLKVTNAFWIWVDKGTLQNSNGAIPVMLLTGETPLGGEAPLVGLLYVTDVNTTAGGFEYIQRVAEGSLAGDWVFRNITQENTNMPFVEVTESSGGLLGGVTGVTFDNDSQSDGTPGPLLQLNVSNGYMQNVTFLNDFPGQPGQYSAEVVSGTLRNATSINSGAVLNSSGQPLANVFYQGGTTSGTDVVGPNSDPYGESYPFACNGFTGACQGLKNVFTRYFAAGNPLAQLALDASYGVLFGDGVTHGFTSGLKQSATGDIDVTTQALLPPTSFTGTATTGGSLATGTYYAVAWDTSSAAVNHCSPSPNGQFWKVSSFVYAGPVTVSGSDNAINLSWTAPQPSPATVAGYCISISTTNPGFDGPVSAAILVTGATSFLYTGQSQTALGSIYPVGNFVTAHRFTYDALGINTTAPAYNLDVNGTAAVNSLNGVQKAERFAGADAAAQINACLTAAQATSGVCDARGMTGTYAATVHITVPAHTELLWCQGKLTINDSSTNDAIELGGDGAALEGCGETGSGTVPRPQASGYIACGIAGCTDVENPSEATANIDWIHVEKMYLQADGANSTVVNLTSIGHADVENNRFVLGTGGGSYGVYGNTSTGNEDSTNSLVKHNEFDAQSQNDTCLYLAGVFNSIKVEQNSCYLPAENTGTIGFALAKDSNGNYPDNDEFDANDCEAATTSFGQICFNLIGSQNVQIGPTNRCENVYNCIQFPSDGSAVGNHMIDPYLSLSVNTMVKPNEPAAAQQAMDNTGTNWQPSFHYGLSDLGGANLLMNPGFEGWSNSTTLFGWGGVNGTNINQPGSGIYAQQQSGSAPADATTQGSYNVKIGDNATAGLGIDSVCVQVDPTMNYTLAFRVASTSTTVKFRPGFRFYSDPNCTEADRITSVSTNARVLQPAYYAGTSTLAGTGANWQSTNASLTYNNGITCNCNVTGADFSVASANTWTPTRNFAITFRVPNAFSSSSTTAQSMRVFVLENTTASPNQIFVDDLALSEGPVNVRVPHTSTVTENGACVGCGVNTVSSYSMGTVVAGEAPGAANQVDLSVVYLPNVTFSHITVDVSAADSNVGDFYSWAITDLAGNVKCSMSSPVNLTATGTIQAACSQGTVTLANGNYVFAFTGSATTAKIAYSGTAPLALSTAVSTSTSSSGGITFPVGMPTAGQTFSSYGLPAIILN